MTTLRPRPPRFVLSAFSSLAALAILAAASSSPSAAAEIVALCIGNDNYLQPEDRLDTPVADANLMAETLRAIPGVREEDVVLLEDGTRESIRTALRRFRDKARGAKLAIVFFSGHGMEDQPPGYDRAETFLLPVEAEIVTADHLPDRAVGLSFVLEQFRGLPPGGRVVILDCCRTGAPSATKALAGAGKNVSEDLDVRVARALGQAELTEGTMVSFSAGPGRKAAAFLQDTDAYSPFTHFLAQGIRERGGNLFDLVSEATATTREATGGRQVPRLRFDGDPSLISAVRIAAARPAPIEESAEVRAMREQLAALEGLVEQLRAQGVANEQLREQVATMEAALVEATGPGAMAAAPPAEPSLPSVPLVPSVPSESPAPAPGTMARTDPEPTGAFPAGRGMEGSRAGEVREFGGIEMVWCPPGEFTMGSPAGEEGRFDNERQHRVTLRRGFWLAKTEATQGQWEAVMGTNVAALKRTGSSTFGEVTATGADVAMYFVNWDDVQGWLNAMNERHPLPEGWVWELPTEAQWEYACRAGTPGAYGGTGNLGEMGWYLSNSGSKAHPVGRKRPNAWGLYDMHGNVWEWCRDWYGEYPSGASTDPSGPRTGDLRVFRGGSWDSGAQRCRSARRHWNSPDFRYYDLGFRPAAVPSRKQGAAEQQAGVEAAERTREEAGRRAAMAETTTPSAAAPSAPTLPSESPAPATMARTDPEPPGAFPASRGMEGRRAGEVREFGGIEMVWCPPGEFLMGSPEGEEGRNAERERQHRVTLTRGFWLAKYECTQRQWERVMGNNPSRFKGADLPVETVSWNDVLGWLKEMNERHPLPEGWVWDLPTEAQWEYACRAGTTGAYGGTGKLDEMGWYRDNSGSKTHPVGGKQANAWGLHDMHGNVWEWCRDRYGEYPTGAVGYRSGPEQGSHRVYRGGGWFLIARYCRAAHRYGSWPDFRGSGLGFRPAAVPPAR